MDAEKPSQGDAEQPIAPDLTPNSSSRDEADGMEGVVNEFLVESYENLDQLDRDLVQLEQNPTEKSLLGSIFRIIHTIKGTCGFLGFSKLESLSHVGESLLSKLRDGELLLGPESTSALLTMVDAVRQILSCIENERNEGTVDYSGLIETLSRLTKGQLAGGKPTAPPPPAVPASAPEKVIESLSLAPVPATVATVASHEGMAPVKIDTRASDAVDDAVYRQQNPERRQRDERKTDVATASIADNSIRVDVSILDKLMNLVGELVLARNQILQYSSSTEAKDSGFVATTQHLNLITSELQEGVMKTRMQPIGNIWSKFPRVVRDLALACNKQVRIEMEGKDTELDKTIIEAIKDPLTHIVRNSVDHGIESPDIRVANGKQAEGCVLLRAFHEGGQVIIEISDDGGGINTERVRDKAVERSLITPEQAARMSERELVNLIFLPGFSTAAKVTNVSGRGVGMDVVKTNIEKIGGSVDIQNQLGHGTSLKVKIPLTLAIIPALVVTCSGDRYAIPQVNLLELVRLDQQVARGVEMIHGTPVYRLRGNLLPLVYLSKELALKQVVEKNLKDGDAQFIVVLQADDRQFGLIVEGIADTEEIVVKPLGKQLRGIKAFAGATIMGDGKVALILDVLGLAQNARVVSEVRDRALTDNKSADTKQATKTQNMLVFAVGDKGRMAILLDMVGRLEEFDRTSIESSGEQDVVQYRGEIMPLIYLSKVFHTTYKEQLDKPIQAVVYAEKGKSVGLVVDQILDIVDEEVTVKSNSNRPGVLGSAVIKQRITDLVDVREVIRTEIPNFYDQQVLALQGRS